jgi:ketosteroid isomerase-like protein
VPYLIAGLILPALLTWLLGDAMGTSDEDRLLLFVALFVTFFIGSIAIAQLMEHGQQHRRNQLVQELKPLQTIKAALGKYRLALAGLVLLAGVYAWFPKGNVSPQPVLMAKDTPAEPAPAAKPNQTAAPAPAPATQERELARVRADIQAWSVAWEARNLEGYLAAYSPDFAPNDGVPRQKWEQVRRQRISSAQDIAVKVLNLTLEPLGKDQIKATFTQNYQARGMNDVSRKTLILRKQGDSWKIESEKATPLKG